jgi:hypothetical protein
VPDWYLSRWIALAPHEVGSVRAEDWRKMHIFLENWLRVMDVSLQTIDQVIGRWEFGTLCFISGQSACA